MLTAVVLFSVYFKQDTGNHAAGIPASPASRPGNQETGQSALTEQDLKSRAEPITGNPGNATHGSPADRQPAGGQESASPEKSCPLNLDQLVKKYEKDVKKEQADLDSRIAWPQVGSLHIREYISGYNQKITALHGKAAATANNSSCVFPIADPALLPADYLPAGL